MTAEQVVALGIIAILSIIVWYLFRWAFIMGRDEPGLGGLPSMKNPPPPPPQPVKPKGWQRVDELEKRPKRITIPARDVTTYVEINPPKRPRVDPGPSEQRV